MIYSAIIFNLAQRTAAMLLNNEEGGVEPRLMDADNPGFAINFNADAEGYEVGDGVNLSECYLEGVQLVNNPDYQSGNPDLVAYCRTLPFVILDTDLVFQPTPQF